LHYLGYPSIPVIVNIASINIVEVTQPANSTLLIWPRGFGKGTLLEDILQKSNPKFFPELPSKLFESEILKLPDEFFDKKVWIHEDLITLFRGTSTKQRQQLMNFFNVFLSRGHYSRKDRKVKGKIVCAFGVAREFYRGPYRREMFQLTFLDRFSKIWFDLDESTKSKILELRNENSEARPPRVKLPFKSNTKVEIPEEFNKEINEIAINWDRNNVMSFVRAQITIQNFLRACAFLNKRKSVEEVDLRLFRFVQPLYHPTPCSELQVRNCILKYSLNFEKVSGEEIKREVRACGERRIEEILQQIREREEVYFEKRGKSYEYWIW
jgi:hypothetical protein